MIDENALHRVCETTLLAAGYELVALEWGREPQGFVLRVYIDHPEGDPATAGHPITVDDCTRASRDLSAGLDVADLIDQAFTLEVSSPGLRRPLVKERDFVRFAGRRAHLRLVEPESGRRNFSGTLRGAALGRVAIECDGQLFELPLEKVKKAHLELEQK